MNYLQPYKGKDTRHDCPSCGQKQSFTLYLDGNTHEPIHRTVGKCNRESKCGYHYTPKQYFMDNPSLTPPLVGGRVGSACHVSKTSHSATLKPPLAGGLVGSGSGFGTIHFSFVEHSASYKSNFIRFLCEILTDEQIHSIGENYALGATKNKEVIFWQIDIHGKVRTGKIMQYNPETGHRLKHESGAIDWVHNKLKKSGTLPENYNLQQCFFGEHLLKLYPDKPVAIVESEKSALIASAVFPDLVWLGAGNIHGLTIEKCQVLKGRNVTLFPDLGAFEKWTDKAELLNFSSPSPETKKVRFLSPLGESPRRGIEVGEGSGVRYKISISTLLENEATDIDRANGLDIADYIISELKSSLSSRRGVRGEVIPEIQSFFSPTLQSMIDKNKALLILINGLGLEKI